MVPRCEKMAASHKTFQANIVEQLGYLFAYTYHNIVISALYVLYT